MKSYFLLAGAIGLIALSSCTEKGPAQQGGERIDEIVDNVKKGDPPLKKKGQMEKLGDSIDDAMPQTEDN